MRGAIRVMRFSSGYRAAKCTTELYAHVTVSGLPDNEGGCVSQVGPSGIWRFVQTRGWVDAAPPNAIFFCR